MYLNETECSALASNDTQDACGYIMGYRVMLGDMQWVALGDGRLHKFDDAAIYVYSTAFVQVYILSIFYRFIRLGASL